MGCNNSTAKAPQQKDAGASDPKLLGKEGAPTDAKPVGPFQVKLGAPFPDFEFQTAEGKFKFHEFLGKEGSPAWTILFSYSKDFMPVGTTELAICSGLVNKLTKMGVKLVGLSCDTVAEHQEWAKDVHAVKQQHAGVLRSLLDKVEDALGIGEEDVGFPLIADEKREIATMLGMIDPNGKDAVGTAMPAHSLFVIGPDRTNRATILYPATTGRNFAEVLRLVESLIPTDPAAAPAAQAAPSEPSAPVPVDFQVKLGATFPDFACKTTDGEFAFYEFLGREPSWTVLFTYPKDFVPACTMEMGKCNSMVEQFKEQGVKLIGLSSSSVSEHEQWTKDIMAGSEAEGGKLSFPLIADESHEIAARLGVLDPSERDASGAPMPARAVFFIAPDKTNRATLLYPATMDGIFDEVLRVASSLRLAQDGKLATPGNWERGDRVLVVPAVTAEEVKEFTNLEVKELPSQKPYLRFVDCPGAAAVQAAEPSKDQTPKSTGEADATPAKGDKVTLTEVPASKNSCCC